MEPTGSLFGDFNGLFLYCMPIFGLSLEINEKLFEDSGIVYGIL
jgi:hypothetical protein